MKYIIITLLALSSIANGEIKKDTSSFGLRSPKLATNNMPADIRTKFEVVLVTPRGAVVAPKGTKDYSFIPLSDRTKNLAKGSTLNIKFRKFGLETVNGIVLPKIEIL
jgi:hypothetical protein